MGKTDRSRVSLSATSLVLALLMLGGCAAVIPPPPPVEPVTVDAAPEAPPAPPVVEVPVAPVTPEPAPGPVAPQVAVVMSESLRAYKSVADEVLPYLENYDVYDLSLSGRTPQETFSAIAAADSRVVVAIGLPAAKAAKRFAEIPVVFAQVFNVQDSGLIADNFKGVAVLPPLDSQAEIWREMAPGLRRVGAILGGGHEALIVEAQQAMARQGVEFRYAVATSDRETQYHFDQMLPEIDGFLLFPDNRILSPTVLTNILKDAARHQVQVAVFGESLLAHGATFSTSSDDKDIAGKIVIAINQILAGNIDSVPALAPLTEIRIDVNPAMAARYQLKLDGVDIRDSVAVAQ